MNILGSFDENPVAAAVRSIKDLEAALVSQTLVIFILNSDLLNVGSLVEKVRESGKCSLIHLDFVEGLGKDHRAVDYIHQKVKPDGVISTRSSIIKYAKELGIFTVQRFFLIDSQSYDTMIKNVQAFQPDMLEIMPAVMPGVIKRICSDLHLPVIGGGLVTSKEDIINVLSSGAVAVSTGKKELWNI